MGIPRMPVSTCGQGTTAAVSTAVRPQSTILTLTASQKGPAIGSKRGAAGDGGGGGAIVLDLVVVVVVLVVVDVVVVVVDVNSTTTSGSPKFVTGVSLVSMMLVDEIDELRMS
jgi:hypothetical protein